MDWTAIGVISTIVIALIVGGLWAGKLQSKVTTICTTVTNHLTHDTADIKKSLGEIKEDMAEVKTDIVWLKEREK